VAKSGGHEARKPGLLSERLRVAFGQRCREARLKRGLSQQEVAALSGVAQATIAKIEHGQKNITLETMIRIVRVVDREFARRLRADLKVRFGANVRAARKEAGLSQEELSALAGVKSQFISLIETGRANAKLETVVTMAQALGSDPNELLDGIAGEGER
jgi:transcriptional regulator with XRE-family HTH domain